MEKLRNLAVLFIIAVLPLLSTSCSDDDDEANLSGINLIGTWLIHGDEFGGSYETQYVYVIKKDGTIDYYRNAGCECSKKMKDGIIDCSFSHYEIEGHYEYNIKNNVLYVEGSGVRALKKESNDEFITDSFIFEESTITYKRVKGFSK